MPEPRTFSYPSNDGVHTIHAQEWLPQGRPRAVIQIVHGVAEYIGRYDHVAQFLTGYGFLVCGEDHLGHGYTVTDGQYGYFAKQNGWSLVVEDIRRLCLLQAEKYPGIPYFLLGHSMGSFLTRTYLCRWPGEVDGAILSGTGQEPAFLVWAGKALAGLLSAQRGPTYVSPLVNAMSLGAYNKKFAPNRTNADWLSRDEAVVDIYIRDHLCRFLPTCGMFRDMMDGLQEIASPANLARMDKTTPVYFFSGDKDPVGSQGRGVKKVVGMFRRAGCRDVSLKLYPEGRHEMFNEINQQEVLEDLLAWLESKLL